MPKKFKVGCQRPTTKLTLESNLDERIIKDEKGAPSMIHVGKKAPVFELAGYHKGEFLNFKLSEYLGQWVVLCFYPGDFTFV